MTDKEIIIDGVDVSKCGYRDWRTLCHCNNTKEIAVEEKITGRYCCEYNPNCHFKQLKRKEQECEELKKEKAEIKKYLGISSKTIMQRLEELQERKDKLSVREYNYEQALDEIEDIADDYNRVGKTSQYYRDGFDEIQDIINKAKED